MSNHSTAAATDPVLTVKKRPLWMRQSRACRWHELVNLPPAKKRQTRLKKFSFQKSLRHSGIAAVELLHGNFVAMHRVFITIYFCTFNVIQLTIELFKLQVLSAVTEKKKIGWVSPQNSRVEHRDGEMSETILCSALVFISLVSSAVALRDRHGCLWLEIARGRTAAINTGCPRHYQQQPSPEQNSAPSPSTADNNNNKL